MLNICHMKKNFRGWGLCYNVSVFFTTHELAKCWCMTQGCKLEGSLVWSTSCVSHSDTELANWLTVVEPDY